MFGIVSSIECVIVLDLYYTLSNPFRPPSTRNPTYFSVSIAVGIIFATLLALTDFDFKSPYNIAFVGLSKVAYFGIAIPTFIYTTKFFRKSGLNKQYRDQVFTRHLLYAILTLICQVTTLFDWFNTIGVLTMPEWL